jgi:hypothetical protein
MTSQVGERTERIDSPGRVRRDGVSMSRTKRPRKPSPRWTYDVRLKFGKHKGKTLLEVYHSEEGIEYLQWICATFEDGFVKNAVAEFLAIPVKPRLKKEATEVVRAEVRESLSSEELGRAFEPGLFFMGQPVSLDELERTIGLEAAQTIAS